MLLLGLAVSSRSTLAADSPRELARILSHRAPVSWLESTGDNTRPLVRLSVPPELLRAARPDLFDLRILACDAPDAFQEISFLLRRPLDVVRIVERPAKILNLSEREDSTEFLLDASHEKATVNSLLVQVDDASRNYERRVRVHGADLADAADWKLLADNGYLLDVSRPGHRMTVSRIDLPPSEFRWFQVSIINDGRPPLKITGGRLLDRAEERATRRVFDAPRISVDHDSLRNESRFVFDLGSDLLPISTARFDVVAPDKFLRTANLQISDENGLNARWRTVGAAQLYSISRTDLLARDTTANFSEVSGRYLRLTVQNGDESPLDIAQCHCDMMERVLVVDYQELSRQKVGQVHLYVGNDRLEQPQYDLARTVGSYSLAELPEITAGPLSENPFFKPEGIPEVPWNERHKPLLWGVTLLCVALVGGLAVLFWKRGVGKGV